MRISDWSSDVCSSDLNFLAVLLGCEAVGGANRAQWCYQPFEDLIQKAKTVSDNDKRTELYEQAQVVFKEQAPWATIAHSVVFKPVRKDVKHFTIEPFHGQVLNRKREM